MIVQCDQHPCGIMILIDRKFIINNSAPNSKKEPSFHLDYIFFSFLFRRVESRRECFDLQNLVVQIPERPRNKNRQAPKPSNYPVALVPGQFQEYYRTYSAAELL